MWQERLPSKSQSQLPLEFPSYRIGKERFLNKAQSQLPQRLGAGSRYMARTISKQARWQLPFKSSSPRNGKNDFKPNLYRSFLKTISLTVMERTITKQPLVAASDMSKTLTL
jgi:hypothetical protein